MNPSFLSSYDADSPVHSLLDCGRYLFVGLGNGLILQWDDSENIKRVLQGHTWSVSALLESDNILYSGSGDRNIRLWDIPSGQIIKVIPTRSWVRTLTLWRGLIISGGGGGAYHNDNQDPFIYVW